MAGLVMVEVLVSVGLSMGVSGDGVNGGVSIGVNGDGSF